MTELWLIWHGQTDWNLKGRWQGQVLDAPGLNDAGYAQARSIHTSLKEIKFSTIYRSDRLRARQTATLVAESKGLTITLEPRRREISPGIWEGMLWKKSRRNTRGNWRNAHEICSIHAR